MDNQSDKVLINIKIKKKDLRVSISEKFFFIINKNDRIWVFLYADDALFMKL